MSADFAAQVAQAYANLGAVLRGHLDHKRATVLAQLDTGPETGAILEVGR